MVVYKLKLFLKAAPRTHPSTGVNQTFKEKSHGKIQCKIA